MKRGNIFEESKSNTATDTGSSNTQELSVINATLEGFSNVVVTGTGCWETTDQLTQIQDIAQMCTVQALHLDLDFYWAHCTVNYMC